MARSKAAGGLILPAGAKSQARRESVAASRTVRNRHQRVHQDHQTRGAGSPEGNKRAEAGAGQDARIVSRSSLRGLVMTGGNIEKPPVKSTAESDREKDRQHITAAKIDPPKAQMHRLLGSVLIC